MTNQSRSARRTPLQRATALLLSWVLTGMAFAGEVAALAPSGGEVTPAAAMASAGAQAPSAPEALPSAVPDPPEPSASEDAPQSLKVKPILECVVRHAVGSYTAHFGYENQTGGQVTIPVGPNNFFAPPPEGRGQPTLFEPGRTPPYPNAAFTVPFGPAEIFWTLRGPDNVARTAKANGGSRRCDQLPPEVVIVSPAHGSHVGTSTPEFYVYYKDATAIQTSSFTAHVDGIDRSSQFIVDPDKAFWASTPAEALASGKHTFTVTIADTIGNVGTATSVFTVDADAPVVTITSPDEGSYHRTVPLIAGTVQETDPQTKVYCTAGPNTVEARLEWSGTTATFDCQVPLEEGPNDVVVQAADSGGHTGSATRRLYFDTTAPQVTVLEPQEGSYVSATTVTVSGGVVDASPIASVTVRGVTAVVTGATFTATGVPVGNGPTETLTAEAVDAAGNTGSDSNTVSVDRTPPVIEIATPVEGAVVAGPVAVAGTVVETTPFTVEVNGQAASVSGNAFTATVPAATDGPLAIVATARDAAAQTGTDTVNVTVDTTAPVLTVTAPAPGLVTRETTVVIAGTVVDSSAVTLTIDGVTVPVASGSFSHTQPLPNEVTYTFTVVATDAAGRTDTETVTVRVDRTPPQVTVVTPTPGGQVTSLPVAVQGTVADASTVTLTVEGVAAVVTGGAWTASLPTLPEGPQSLDVLAVDEAGNETSLAHPIVVNLGAPVVTITAPAPGTLTSAASITVEGTVAESQLQGVVVSGVSATVTPNGPGLWLFSAANVPLAENTNLLQAVATDASSQTGSATVEVIRDSTPPQVVLEAPDRVPPGTTFTLEATPTDLHGIARVDLLLGDEVLASPTAPPYRTQVSVPPSTPNGTTLVVRARAFDVAGNETMVSRGVLIVSSGIVAGQVLSDATSLPVEGALVQLLSGGAPDVTTDALGRYSFPVTGTGAVVRASRTGMAAAERVVTVEPGVGTIPVDARLTPLAEPVTVGPAGGTLVADSPRPLPAGLATMRTTVTVPAGAVSGDVPFHLTALSPQGLPGLLPLGWASVLAFDLRAGAAVGQPMEAAFTGLASGSVHLVAYNATLHGWLMAEPGLEAVAGALAVGVPGPGTYGLVRADDVVPPLPVPAVGEVLPSAAFVAIPESATSTSTVTPPTLPPTGGTARGSLIVTSSEERLPSGTVVQAEVTETFTLTSGPVVSVEKRTQDILLSHEDAGAVDALRADVPITPARTFQTTELMEGRVHLDILAGREGIRGNPGGQQPVTVSDGDAILRIPGGALPEDTLVTLDQVPLSSFLPQLPGLTAISEAVVGLQGRTLTMPAELSVAGASVPAGQTLFLARIVRPTDVPYPMVVAMAELQNGRVATVPAAGLPGLREEGRYVFFRTTRSVGFVSGLTQTSTGPIAALVQTSAMPFVGLSGSDGSYAVMTETGSVTLTARALSAPLSGTEMADVEAGVFVTADILLAGTQTTATVTPANGAIGVATGAQVEIRTSAPILPGSITVDTVRLVAAAAVPVRFQLSASGKLLYVIPEDPLLPDTEYTLVVNGLLDLASAAIAVPATTFRTADNTPPEYDTDLIVFSFPDENGLVHVTAPPDSMPPGTEILIINSGNGVVVTFTFDNDGAVNGEFPATLDDQLLVTITDPFGNVTTFQRSQYVAPDGTTAVGAGGGVVKSPDGSEVRIPAGATPQAVTLKIEPFDETAPQAAVMPSFGTDPQGNPIARFGGGLTLESQDRPVFSKEVDLAFPLPDGLPAEPNDAFFYVFRRRTLAGGQVVQEVIDQAFIEGEGDDRRVVTASYPFPGYLNSAGVAENHAFLMWTHSSQLPGQPLAGAITGKVLRTVWPEGAPEPSFEPIRDREVTVRLTDPGPGGGGSVAVPRTSDGTFTLWDIGYTGGVVEVTATTTNAAGEPETLTVPAYEANPANWATTGLRFYRNIATANVTFPLESAGGAPPSLTIDLVNATTGQLVTGGIVPEGTPLKGVLRAVNANVSAARVQAQGCTVVFPDPQDLTVGEVDLAAVSPCRIATPGAYTVEGIANPAAGAPVNVVRTLLVVAAGGGNNQILEDVPPAVIEIAPADGTDDVPISALPQLVFSEPVTQVTPERVLLEELLPNGTAAGLVGVSRLAVLRDGTVVENPTADAQIVSLTLKPLVTLRYGTRYRMRIEPGIVDLDAPPDGPRALAPPYAWSFETYAPGSTGGSPELYGSMGIALLGGRVFLAEVVEFVRGMVHAFDISVPGQATEILEAQAPLHQRPVDLAARAGGATTRDELAVGVTITAQSKPSNLYLFDVQNPLETRWVGVTSVSNSTLDGILTRVVFKGGFAYVLTQRKGIQVIDVQQAKSLFATQTGGVTNSAGYFAMLQKIHTEGQGFGQAAIVSTILYPYNSNEQWQLWDLEVATHPLAGTPQPVAYAVGEERVAGNWQFVVANPQTAGRVTSLVLLTPDDLSFRGREMAVGRVAGLDVAVVAGFAVMSSGEQVPAVRVLDLTDPAAPEPLGFVVIPPMEGYSGDVTDVQLRGDLALVAGREGVALVNLATLAQPQVAGVVTGIGGRIVVGQGGLFFGSAYSTFGGTSPLGGVRIAQLEPPACGSLAELLTPRVKIEVVRDPANGTVCGDDDSVIFSLCKPARVTFRVDGQVFDGSLDGEPDAAIEDVLLGPGAHAIKIPRTLMELNLDDKPFRLEARDESGPAETHEGTIESDLKTRSVLPVGHTFVKGVDTLDGHLVRQSADIKIPGRHLGLEVTRTYSSSAKGQDGVMGAGWSWNFASSLTPTSCGQVALSTADGSSQVFRFDNGAYKPQKGYHGTLTRNGDEFTYTDKSGTRHHFREKAEPGSADRDLRLDYIEEPHGDRLRMTYDNRGRLIRVSETHVEEPDVAVRWLNVEYEQRAGFDRITRIESPALALRVDYEHDAKGNLERATRRGANLDGPAAPDRVESYAYTVDNPRDPHHMTAAVDANGNRTEYVHLEASDPHPGHAPSSVPGGDKSEYVKRVLEYPTAGGDPNETLFSYEARVPTAETFVTRVRDARENWTRYELNAYGAPKLIREAEGTADQRETSMVWRDADVLKDRETDAEQRLTVYDYDERGNLALERIERDGSTLSVTEYAYDQRFGKLTGKTVRDADGSPRWVTTYEIGDRGDLEEMRDAEGNRTVYTYDPQGRLQQVTSPRGYTTAHANHDSFGNPRLVTDPESNTVTRQFDARGRLTLESDSFGRETTSVFDGMDRPVSVQRRAGGGSDDELTRTGYFDGGEVREVRRRVRTGEDVVTTFELDGLNRVKRALTQLETGEPALESLVTYDANGNKETETDRRGVRKRMTYDALNRVRTVAIEAGPAAGPLGPVASFTYDAVGNKRTETDINGFVTDFRYDGLYRVAKKLLPEPCSLGAVCPEGRYEENYAYDRVGNRTSFADANGKVTATEYDRLNRPTRVVRDPGGLGLETRSTYQDSEPTGSKVNKSEEQDVTRGLRTLFTYDTIERETVREVRLEGEDGDPATGVVTYRAETTYRDDEHATVVEDPRGKSVYTRLDGLNRVVEQVADFGEGPEYLNLRTQTLYDALGNRKQVTDPKSQATTFRHDGLGRLREVRDADLQPATFGYDGEGLKTSEEDRRQVEKAHTYDNLARPLTSALVNTPFSGKAWSRSTQYVDGASPARIERDALGQQTRVDLDRLGRVTRETDDAGKFRLFTYDGVNKRSETDKRPAHHRTEFRYDAVNRLVEVKDPPIAGQPDQLAQTTYLDSANRTQETDRRGIVKHTQTDPLGRVRSVRRQGPTLNVTLERHTYDGNGNRELSTDADGHQTRFVYDGANRLAERIDGFGSTPDVSASTFFRYDPNGNLTKEIEPGSTELVPSLEKAYDALNRVTDEWNGERERTQYGYDTEGNRIRVVEAVDEQTTTFAYDELGKLLRVTQPGARETRYEHDFNRNRVKQFDAENNEVEMTYDRLNRLDLRIQKGAPEGDLVTDYAYDENGSETSVVDPKGQTTGSVYDEINRLQVRTYAALPAEAPGMWRHTTRIEYDYDPNNNLTEVRDFVASGADPPVDQVTTRSYDDLDRLTSETTPLAAEPSETRTVSYTYYGNGTRRSIVDPSGRETRYTYDGRSRLASVTTEFGTAQAATTSYTYHPDSLLHQVTYPSGVAATHLYDGADRLTSLVNAQGATVVSSYTYTYDDNGNRLSQVEVNGHPTPVTETTAYTYDALNRLETVTYPSDASFPAGREVTYGYDNVGNRTAEVTRHPTTQDVLADKTGVFDALNRLTELTDNLVPAQTVTFAYDRNGNQLSKQVGAGTPTLYRYECRDRLIEVTEGAATPGRYQYDFLGRRSQKLGADGQIQFVYDQTSTLLEYAGTGLERAKYDYGSERLIRLSRSDEGTRFFSFDGLGSVTALTDTTGSRVAAYHLDAWGVFRNQGELGASQNRFAFTGYLFDRETELYFAKARFYDPEIGRFTTQDSFLGEIDAPPSLHRFFYGNANPLRFIDPTGHQSAPANPSSGAMELSELDLSHFSEEERKRITEANPEVAARLNRERKAVVVQEGGPRGDQEIEACAGDANETICRQHVWRKRDSLKAMGTVGVVGEELSYTALEFVPGAEAAQIAAGETFRGEKVDRASAAGEAAVVTIVSAAGGYLAYKVGNRLFTTFKEARKHRDELAAARASRRADFPNHGDDLSSNQRMVDQPLGQSADRGLTWTTERTGKSNAASEWEDSVPGASYDIATRRRNVPALRIENRNPNGESMVRFDGVDPSNPRILIDRKWGVTTKTEQVEKFQDGPLQALEQNPGYRLRIEVPNKRAQTDARRLLRYSTGADTHPQIDIVVVPR